MSEKQERIAHAKKLVKEVQLWSRRKLYITYSQLENKMKFKTKSTQRFNRTGQRGSCACWGSS